METTSRQSAAPPVTSFTVPLRYYTVEEQLNYRGAIRYIEYVQGYSAESGDLLQAFAAAR